MSARPVCLLLLPRKLEGFILRDQAEELLASPGVEQLPPPRVPYGLVGRLPAPVGKLVASLQAARRTRNLRRRDESARAVVIFHPLQLPLAEALINRAGTDCE